MVLRPMRVTIFSAHLPCISLPPIKGKPGDVHRSQVLLSKFHDVDQSLPELPPKYDEALWKALSTGCYSRPLRLYNLHPPFNSVIPKKQSSQLQSFAISATFICTVISGVGIISNSMFYEWRYSSWTDFAAALVFFLQKL